MTMNLSIMGLIFSSLGFFLLQTHTLSLLICLEGMMLSLLLLLFSFLSGFSGLFWFLLLLTFAACEAALGLSLLVSLLRLRGNDHTLTISSNMF